jgi:hypothetical protein
MPDDFSHYGVQDDPVVDHTKDRRENIARAIARLTDAMECRIGYNESGFIVDAVKALWDAGLYDHAFRATGNDNTDISRLIDELYALQQAEQQEQPQITIIGDAGGFLK